MYTINAWPYSVQVDAIMIPRYASSNGGSVAFLLLVDILSRKTFAYVLESMAMQEILRAYKQFICDAKHLINSVVLEMGARRLVSSTRTRAGKQLVNARVKVKQLQSMTIIRGSKKPCFQSASVDDQRRWSSWIMVEGLM